MTLVTQQSGCLSGLRGRWLLAVGNWWFAVPAAKAVAVADPRAAEPSLASGLGEAGRQPEAELGPWGLGAHVRISLR